MTEPDALAVLEQRVGEKFVKAAAARFAEMDFPDLTADFAKLAANAWPFMKHQAHADVPQFPREQWASYPARRTVVLMLCEQMLDFEDELTDEQWATLCFLMQYGGKTRIA